MARDAGFRWTDDDSVDQDHSLQWPLFGVRPAYRRPSWSRDTIGGAVHTTKATEAAAEIVGVLRFESDPSALIGLLSDQIGRDLTYYETRNGIEFEFPSILVSVTPGDVSNVGLDPDPNRAGFGEYSATVRLRRTDGGAYDWLLTPVTAVYIVTDDDGGYTFSGDGADALTIVADDDSGLTLDDSGTAAAVLAQAENITLFGP